ncbi:ATP-binding protein [Paenibacillus solisilvae]|uniref:histidine kinase n=1 Tax=Paenibacillus solisilvae TaxID=2486751 RepID=A0ABW0VQ42_9BACL
MSQQIASSVIQYSTEQNLLQMAVDERLKRASLITVMKLNGSLNNAGEIRLSEIAKEAGVTHISLLAADGAGYKTIYSSKPSEIGKLKQRDNESDYFLPESPKMSNQGPGYIGKWSFYKDPILNIIISSYIDPTDTDLIMNPLGTNGTDSFLSPTIVNSPILLEISGFNPLRFGHEPITSIPKEATLNQLGERPVVFGSYTFREKGMDEKSVKEAAEGHAVFHYTTINNRAVIKSFVPVQGEVTYIIGLVYDKQPLMKQIDDQRSNQIFISAILLILVVFCSYWLSDILLRPVRSILWKVNEVSFGRFDNSIVVRRKDELGQLAQRVNAMSKNLGIYMTKLKLAFEENRSMKEYLESFINHTTDAIHVVDLEGRITQVNYAFEQLFSYSSEEAIGQILPLAPEHLHTEEQQTMEQLKSGKPLKARETERVTKQGELIAVSVTTSPIRDKHGAIRAIASITRDMTSRNKMEELLRRSEKLTTVGQLAAGVAHEIRNPLTTLRGFLQLQLETSKLNTRHIDIMLTELDRINLIVGEFLILAKPQATRFEDKDIRFILGDVISLLDSQAHLCNIVFDPLFCKEDCSISCEENQLKQVFINVLKNAMEAMPQGGQIRIEVTRYGDKEVSVSIMDEGIGIPDEMISKLGDPFFTDKDTGTGLGIMVSQRIIQSHQGTMEIRSTVNVGTTVTITLPLKRDKE